MSSTIRPKIKFLNHGVSPVELGDMLFRIHTHAEIVYDHNPSEIVYREQDIIKFLKELGFQEPIFDYKKPS